MNAPIRLSARIRPKMFRPRPMGASSIKSLNPLGRSGSGRVLHVEIDGQRLALKLFTKRLTIVSPKQQLWMEALHHELASEGCEKVPRLMGWGDLEIGANDPVRQKLREMIQSDITDGRELDESEDLIDRIFGNDKLTLKYMLMDYVDGISARGIQEYLGDRENPRRITEEAMLAYAHGIARMVQQIQKKGIMHLDIKPGNTLINKDGVILIDYGSAKQENGEIESIQEHYYQTGTSTTMAPEHFSGGHERASDVFSIIASAIWIRFNRHPYIPRYRFNENSVQEWLESGRNIEAKDLNEFGINDTNESNPIVVLLVKALDRDAGERWEVKEVLEKLEGDLWSKVQEGYRQLSILSEAAIAARQHIDYTIDLSEVSEEAPAREAIDHQANTTRIAIKNGNNGNGHRNPINESSFPSSNPFKVAGAPSRNTDLEVDQPHAWEETPTRNIKPRNI